MKISMELSYFEYLPLSHLVKISHYRYIYHADNMWTVQIMELLETTVML